jgi:hypothetical protein
MFNSPVHNYGGLKDLTFSQPMTVKNTTKNKNILREENKKISGQGSGH